MTNKTPTEKQRFQQFVKELTALSKKTGIALDVIGGVIITDPKELTKLRYEGEPGTGDLEARF